MIKLTSELYSRLETCYKFHKQESNLQRTFSKSAPFRYKRLGPETYPIGYIKDRVIMIDDPDILRICYLLSKELPVYTEKHIPFKAQPFESIVAVNYGKLGVLMNVPPTPAGYHISKFHDEHTLTDLEQKCLLRVSAILYPKGFLKDKPAYSFLKKDSSVGIPFHSNTIMAKLHALELGYSIAWAASKSSFNNHSDFSKWLFNEYKLLSWYKIGTRGQIDSPDKSRKDYKWDGTEVDQNKKVSQFGQYQSRITSAANKLYSSDSAYMKWVSELSTRRFRQIMIMPPYKGFLSLAQRVLIDRRKDFLPHLRDFGSDKNIIALTSPGMKITSTKKPIESEDMFFVSMDQKHFDRRWHSKVMATFLSDYDNAIEPPFNISKHSFLSSAAITQPMSKYDAVCPGYITHDNFINYDDMNIASNYSGSPQTKEKNDAASTFILEVICEKAGFGSFIEASVKGNLLTKEFPLSALINGDDILLCILGKDNLNKILKLNDTSVGDWILSFDEIPMWNNQKVVKNEKGELFLVKNHENLPEKILKPEKAFGQSNTGGSKPLPNLGYMLRKKEYDTIAGNEIFDMMNKISKSVLGYSFDEVYTLTPEEELFMKQLENNPLAVNILQYVVDPEKLMYVESLQNLPDEIKSLYYFQITPDIFNSIISNEKPKFLDYFKKVTEPTEFEKRIMGLKTLPKGEEDNEEYSNN